MTKEDVIKLMESSQSEEEWDSNVNKVKQACNGYPSFWYSAVVASGLIKRTAQKWGGDGEIHFSPRRKATL